MPVIKDGKTYYTAEELELRLAKRAEKNAEKFAREVIESQKKQYV